MYTVVGQIGGQTLVYSKTFNALPITKTYVGEQPCIKNDEIQTNKAATFYSLENQKQEKCTIDRSNNQTVDIRFTYLGI